MNDDFWKFDQPGGCAILLATLATVALLALIRIFA